MASKLIYFFFFFIITFFPFLLPSNFIINFPSIKIDLFLFHIPLFFFAKQVDAHQKRMLKWRRQQLAVRSKRILKVHPSAPWLRIWKLNIAMAVLSPQVSENLPPNLLSVHWNRKLDSTSIQRGNIISRKHKRTMYN